MDVTPWLKANKSYNKYDPLSRLHEEIMDFHDYILPLPEEERMRHDVVRRVSEAIIKDFWPDKVNVEVFGSFRAGLFLPTSDIDLVVFGRWKNLPLKRVANAMVKAKIADFSEVQMISKAKVPIVKLTDKLTQVKVDISFNTEGCGESIKLVKDFISRHPNLRYIVYVIKQFLMLRHLNEVYTGGIGSYCLCLLIVSFLQSHRDHSHLGRLLIEFFNMYGHKFDYANTGIRLGNTFSYIPKMHCHGTATLYVEDPLLPENNVARSSYQVMKVKEEFSWAYKVLTEVTSGDCYSGSILAHIIHVNTDVIHYRHRMKHDNSRGSSSVGAASSQFLRGSAAKEPLKINVAAAAKSSLASNACISLLEGDPPKNDVCISLLDDDSSNDVVYVSASDMNLPAGSAKLDPSRQQNEPIRKGATSVAAGGSVSGTASGVLCTTDLKPGGVLCTTDLKPAGGGPLRNSWNSARLHPDISRSRAGDGKQSSSAVNWQGARVANASVELPRQRPWAVEQLRANAPTSWRPALGGRSAPYSHDAASHHNLISSPMVRTLPTMMPQLLSGNRPQSFASAPLPRRW